MMVTFLGICSTGVAIWVAIITGSSMFLRFVNTYYGLSEGGNAMSRFELYEMAWQQFLDGPVFGDFVELRGAYIYPHNFFLEALISTGIVGFILFSTLALGTCILAIRLMRNYPKYGWVSLLYFHYFIYSMVSSALYSNTYFWCSLGLVLGVWQSARYGFIDADVSGNHQTAR
jgi:O-antigen ligase